MCPIRPRPAHSGQGHHQFHASDEIHVRRQHGGGARGPGGEETEDLLILTELALIKNEAVLREL